ncbi:MAG: signal peptidase I [Actinobacteria bacterium]|nr:signal peptidase I [Actinomycetota bacterium]
MTSARHVLREVLETIIIALVLALLIRNFVVERIVVDGTSMETTLHNSDSLLINKFIYRFRLPKTGEIVVFKFPSDPSRDFIKRVIAHEGQSVEMREGRVYVDGALLNEPYVKRPSRDNYPRAVVPKGTIFVLGDNRVNSEDSRFSDVGFVPLKNLKGTAFVRFWPASSFTWIGG